MLKIAISGNIASGKTVVENFFKKNGCKTLCLDEVTRNIYESNKDFQGKLLSNFKTTKKEEISRIVFSDLTKLALLESLIYPFIKDELFAFFNKNKEEKMIFVCAPVLFEKGFDKYFDKIIFVSSDTKNRLQRLMKRNNLSKSEAMKRICAQDDEKNKIKSSDFIIYNNLDLEHLEAECKKVKEELTLLL